MVPLLAEATDYMASWQLPIVAVLGGVWVFLGGYLLRRNVQADVGRRESAKNRCIIIAFLAGLGGIFSAGVAVVLAWQVATNINVQTIWLASPAAAVAFCLVSFLTVLASFKLPAGSVGKKWLKSFGPPLLVTVVAMLPTVWVAETNRQNKLSRVKSFNCLQHIYSGIANRYQAAKPPATLEELGTGNIVEPKFLRAHRHPSRKAGFFYRPVKIVPTDQQTKTLMLCDWVDNLNGKSRTVVYANGKVELLSQTQFLAILALDENKAFAADLKEAESKL